MKHKITLTGDPEANCFLYKTTTSAGLAVLAAAHLHNLDFIPLLQERFDLIIPEAEYKSSRLAPVLDYVHTSAFRKTLRAFGGYDPGETGKDTLI